MRPTNEREQHDQLSRREGFLKARENNCSRLRDTRICGDCQRAAQKAFPIRREQLQTLKIGLGLEVRFNSGSFQFKDPSNGWFHWGLTPDDIRHLGALILNPNEIVED